MGTFYHIKYEASPKDIYATEIDSLLKAINQSLSTYIPSSTISQVNFSGKEVKADPYFQQVFQTAKTVYQSTKGAFDPTVMQLVNAWGFGFKDMENVDSVTIDSLRQFVDFSKVHLKDGFVHKDHESIMLDFAAIAKGFGVDIIADFLESKGVRNYMVEIGGEIRLKGNNPKRTKWTVGLEIPEEKITLDQEYKVIINITNIAIATSGNYRNFYYRGGVKYAHTINPFTGYPAMNDMLSATVFHKSCMVADAYATAFMVMGKEKTMEFVNDHPELKVYLIFTDEKGKEQTWYSEELKEKITSYSE